MCLSCQVSAAAYKDVITVTSQINSPFDSCIDQPGASNIKSAANIEFLADNSGKVAEFVTHTYFISFCVYIVDLLSHSLDLYVLFCFQLFGKEMTVFYHGN